MMKLIPLITVLLFSSFPLPESNLPDYLKGSFTDDYDIQYTVTNSTWTQAPHFEMSIVKIDTAQMYILGYDSSDSTYTRVDYMPFEDQGDFKWGYCYTAYEQDDKDKALAVESANRNTPKSGCNGFPFSRMKRINQ